jgi:simple sugar transport system permease protein
MITIPLGSFNLNLSLVAAVVLCVLIFVYLKYTKHGYEIAVVGDSPNTARYAGMKVGKIVVRTIFLSAALIGLAGAFYVSSAGTMSTSLTNDVGWTGIVVAWLAKLNTVGIVVTALLITVLQFGCQNASTTYSTIDANFADLIQGIILFAVLAADFFTRFQLVRRTKASQEVSK